MTAPARETAVRYGPPFWIAVALGVLPTGYGALLMFAEPVQQTVSGTWRTEPVASTIRFGTVLLLHDLVLLPLVVAVAAVLLRRTTPTWRSPLRFGLFLTGTVLLLAGWGAVAQIADAQPEHPTVLANNYGVSLALLLPPIWGTALAWGLWRRTRSRRTAADPTGDGHGLPVPTGETPSPEL